MPAVTVSTTIARPIDEVFAFVADTRNDPTWAPFVRFAELVEGDAPGPGAVYEIGQVEAGRLARRRMVTTAFDEPSHLAWSMDAGDYTYASTMDLVAVGDDTRITQTNRVEYRIRPVGLVWAGLARFALRRQFVLLRRVLEGGAREH